MGSDPEIDHSVILFDGVCALCNSSVDFVIKNDRKCVFRFAALQSDFAQNILDQLNVPTGDPPESIILLENNKIYYSSTAALRISRRLRIPWNWMFVFIVIPTPLRDSFYSWIARHRYSWFGKRDACRVATPEERALFLD